MCVDALTSAHARAPEPEKPTSAGKEYQKLVENIRETIEEIVSKKKNKFKNGRSANIRGNQTAV